MFNDLFRVCKKSENVVLIITTLDKNSTNIANPKPFFADKVKTLFLTAN